MRSLKYNILFVSILNLCGLSCKEVYKPPAIQNNPHLLVIDGIVIIGNDSTVITLSRTRSITDTAPSVKEADAQVSVVGVSGVEYPFLNQGNGRYVTDRLLLDTIQKYQSKIIKKMEMNFARNSTVFIQVLLLILFTGTRIQPV
jgi:hypothetical protein